jgi:hypothetical protein
MKRALLSLTMTVMSLGAAQAQPVELPPLSTLFEVCSDQAQTLGDRVVAFEGYGLVQAAQPNDLWHAANAAQVALHLNGRALSYSAPGARGQFTSLYHPDRLQPEVEGEAWTALGDTSGDIAVRLFQTDTGLIGCTIALDVAAAWYALDMPLRRDWPTEAGTPQSYETPLQEQRLDDTTLTPIWADWFQLSSSPHVWISISSRPPEITG